MTAGEVEQILGPPSDRTDPEYWVYEKPFDPGWLDVYFDEKGRFVGYNDERGFP